MKGLEDIIAYCEREEILSIREETKLTFQYAKGYNQALRSVIAECHEKLKNETRKENKS